MIWLHDLRKAAIEVKDQIKVGREVLQAKVRLLAVNKSERNLCHLDLITYLTLVTYHLMMSF